MDVRIRFEFNNADLGPGFEILNPAVIPVTGEILDFEWESYISKKEQLGLIKSFLEDNSFIAEVVSKSYSPKEVKMIVVLHKDTDKL